jgi:hypothetical protein
MPDINKFEALRDAGYKIPVTCGLCNHGNFPSAISLWGTCQIIKCNHLKHTGAAREASIVRCGTCKDASLDYNLVRQFGDHEEFVHPKE